MVLSKFIKEPILIKWTLSSKGYTFITQIPEGSWDIQIIERKKSADILGEQTFDWLERSAVRKTFRVRRYLYLHYQAWHRRYICVVKPTIALVISVIVDWNF